MPASLANSSGLFLRARPIYDLARPGYALYGGNPTPGAPNPMLPVATLEVAIAQTRWIFQGQSCGYNAQWTASRRTRLATVLIGYADGLPRTAGMIDGRRGAEVVIGGHRCKLVGRTSMDLSIADVTDLPEGAAEVWHARRILWAKHAARRIRRAMRDDRLPCADVPGAAFR